MCAAPPPPPPPPTPPLHSHSEQNQPWEQQHSWWSHHWQPARGQMSVSPASCHVASSASGTARPSDPATAAPRAPISGKEGHSAEGNTTINREVKHQWSRNSFLKCKKGREAREKDRQRNLQRKRHRQRETGNGQTKRQAEKQINWHKYKIFFTSKILLHNSSLDSYSLAQGDGGTIWIKESNSCVHSHVPN